MLRRYKMYRGKRPASDPLPLGIRQDTRWRSKHPLRPSKELVLGYLANPTKKAWDDYVANYMELLEGRFRTNRGPFNDLAELAAKEDVFIGCSCPTKKNPTPGHCHTHLALRFMKRKFPRLAVGA
jgi:hypothetical protein